MSVINNPVPGVVAKADATTQQANIAPGTVLPDYNVPANAGGTYRVTTYVVVTQAATTSSTMPRSLITYTDSDTGIPILTAVSNAITLNTVGSTNTSNQDLLVPADRIQVKGGTAIRFSTDSYASSGATPMQYAVHIKLEYLGA